MPDFRELADAMVERLRHEGLDVTTYEPRASIPTLRVYDGDGNLLYEKEVGPLPPYTGPTMTVRIEHSDDWTDIDLTDGDPQ